MLCLTRKPGDGITITTPEDRTIRIVVQDIDGSHVRLGIEAERCIEVMRDELRPRQQEAQPDAHGR